VHCGKSIPTEAGHAHPLDEAIEQETRGLVGFIGGERTVFATCTVCYEAGWRPPAFIGAN
jgi:arginine repressor